MCDRFTQVDRFGPSPVAVIVMVALAGALGGSTTSVALAVAGALG